MTDAPTHGDAPPTPPPPEASWRGHVRATLRLGAPLMAAQLTQQAIQVTDTVMLGWYGVEPLAAGVLGTQYFFIGFIIATGLAFAVMPLAAQAEGAGEPAGVRRAVRMGVWAVAAIVVCMMPVAWFSGPILRGLGQEPQLADMAQDYLRIAQWALFPAAAVMVLRSFLAALERAQMVMWAMLAGAVLNAGMNWLLIFGNWGAPELGLRGAAFATLGTHSLTLAVLVLYCQRARAVRIYEVFVRPLRPDWPAFREVLRLGLPISAALLAEVGLFTASSIMMGWLGTVPLAAHGIAMQITSVIFMIPLSLSNAGTVRVGRALGRADAVGLSRAAATVTALALCVALAGAVLLVAAPAPLIGLFLDRANPAADAIVASGVTLLAVAALFQLVDTLQVVSIGLLRGLKDTRRPMAIAVLAYWGLGAPAGYVLGFPLGLGGPGVWLGLAIGLTAAAVALSWRFLSRERLGLTAPPGAAARPA